MKHKVLITGGTGFIGKALCKQLQAKGYEVGVLTRGKSHVKGGISYYQYNLSSGSIDAAALENTKTIIHLAGKSVAEGRWSESAKNEIITSRVKPLELLLNGCKKAGIAPHLISASGSSIYYNDIKGEYDENSEPCGNGFLASVCEKWELAAQKFESIQSPVSFVRTGVVFTKKSVTVKPFQSLAMFPFLGLPSKGNVVLSWIHLDDLVSLYIHLVERKEVGVFNGTAPNPIAINQLIYTLRGGVKSFIFSLPKALFKLVLGQKAEMLLLGGAVKPKRVLESGFTFQHPSVKSFLP